MALRVINYRIKNIILLGFFIFSLSGCKKESSYHPSYSQSKTEKKVLTLGCANRSFYEPIDNIIQNVNKRLKNVQIKIVTGSDYDDYLDKLHHGVYDITFTNGLEALKSQENGYKIVGKFESDSTYYSVIFTNKNSGINQIKDLKGKRFGLSGKGSILGELAPLVFLNQNGLNVYKDLTFIDFPSFESSILNVFLNKCDAGCSWATSWNIYTKSHPEILKKMEVKWKTSPLPNIAIVMKQDMDPKLSEEIINLLLELHKNTNGKTALKGMEYTQVVRANADTYAPLKKLKNDFDNLKK